METKRWPVAVLLVVLAVLTINQLSPGDPAAAEPNPANSVLQYQISAYSGTTPGGVHHGCYIVNTSTGEVFHTRAGGEVEKVSGGLR